MESRGLCEASSLAAFRPSLDGPAQRRLRERAVLLREVSPEVQVVPTDALLCYWDAPYKAQPIPEMSKKMTLESGCHIECQDELVFE